MVFASFSSLIGQPQAVELLSCAVQRQKIAPAYLFAGAEGVGRSIAARGFAALLLAPSVDQVAQVEARIQQRNHPDLLWVEPTYLHQGKLVSAGEAAALGVKRRSPPEIRLEQVREIARFLSRPPLTSPRSVVVLEAADTLAESAANGLLKTLEEPGQATLILMAARPELLLPTIVSRCHRIPFRRLSAEAVAQVLTQAGQPQLLENSAVLALAQGSPGAALFHWQQLRTVPPDLLQSLSQTPQTSRAALELARQLSQLESETQLWLIDYLQQCYWQQHRSEALPALETARTCLLQYVQPRLVWEVTLLKLGNLCDRPAAIG